MVELKKSWQQIIKIQNYTCMQGTCILCLCMCSAWTPTLTMTNCTTELCNTISCAFYSYSWVHWQAFALRWQQLHSFPTHTSRPLLSNAGKLWNDRYTFNRCSATYTNLNGLHIAAACSLIERGCTCMRWSCHRIPQCSVWTVSLCGPPESL